MSLKWGDNDDGKRPTQVTRRGWIVIVALFLASLGFAITALHSVGAILNERDRQVRQDYQEALSLCEHDPDPACIVEMMAD